MADTFQSTRPVWGATRLRHVRLLRCVISIHAPRVGRDQHTFAHIHKSGYFNPRAPCGARQESA